jgi:heme/copper-type cytochrome/quinol oxidase subunit 2
MQLEVAAWELRIQFLTVGEFYSFLATMMIVLFVVGLVVVFVYEYEALRRSKT